MCWRRESTQLTDISSKADMRTARKVGRPHKGPFVRPGFTRRNQS
jgi:hypothetical protein